MLHLTDAKANTDGQLRSLSQPANLLDQVRRQFRTLASDACNGYKVDESTGAFRDTQHSVLGSRGGHQMDQAKVLFAAQAAQESPLLRLTGPAR